MLRERLRADPRGWMAQRPVALSTSPVLIGETLAPRHIDLRPFAVNDGDDVWLLPGGLTRVALPEGELVVNSSQGGGSKDTWVLARPRGQPPAEAEPPPSPRAAALALPAAQPGRRWPPSPGRADPSSDQRAAQPDGRDPVLDRPLRGAGRRHRPAGRRVRAPAARRPGVQRAGSDADCGPLFGILGVDPRAEDAARRRHRAVPAGLRHARARARSPARCWRRGPAPAASAR